MVLEEHIEYLDGYDLRMLGPLVDRHDESLGRKEGPKAYYVRIKREGVETAKLFTLSHYSSDNVALSEARIWKDAKLLELDGTSYYAKKVRRPKYTGETPTTGVVGVSRCFNKAKRSTILQESCYSAYYDKACSTRSTSFGAGRSNIETGEFVTYTADREFLAFRLAVYMRKLFEMCREEGLVFEPLGMINSKTWRTLTYEQHIEKLHKTQTKLTKEQIHKNRLTRQLHGKGNADLTNTKTVTKSRSIHLNKRLSGTLHMASHNTATATPPCPPTSPSNNSAARSQLTKRALLIVNTLSKGKVFSFGEKWLRETSTDTWAINMPGYIFADIITSAFEQNNCFCEVTHLPTGISFRVGCVPTGANPLVLKLTYQALTRLLIRSR